MGDLDLFPKLGHMPSTNRIFGNRVLFLNKVHRLFPVSHDFELQFWTQTVS